MGVASLFVECVYHVAKEDYQERVRAELDQQKRWSEQLRELFYEADTDESDSLSWIEFKSILQNNKVMKAFFRSLELNLKDSKKIFEYLDVRGKGELNLADFIQGCTVLRGEAKSVDIAVLRSEWERMWKQLAGQVAKNSNELHKLSKVLVSQAQVPQAALIKNATPSGLADELRSSIAREQRGPGHDTLMNSVAAEREGFERQASWSE